MVHIDTLQVYEDLVTSGVPDKQAKAQVHALNASFDSVATKGDLNNLESRLESKIESKFAMLMALGAAMFAVHTFPVIQQLKETSPASLAILGFIILSVFGLYSYFKNRNKPK